MKLKIQIYISLFSVLLWPLLSCCHHEYDNRLTAAESLIDEYPDSALAVLAAVCPDSLRSRSERAAYGLLYTRALDMNHLDSDNDSLISAALSYYEGHGDRRRQILCHHYRGRVYQHKGNYPQAMVSFFKAKQLAEEDGDLFRAGMACRGISDIYMECFNAADELTFARKEYEYMRASGKQPYLNYSLHDLGRALYNNREFDAAIAVSVQLTDSAAKSEDLYLYKIALQLKGLSLIAMKDYKQAYPIFEEICKNIFVETRDSLELSRILVESGEIDRGMRLLNEISDDYDLPLKNFIRYRAYKNSKQYEKALIEAEYTDSVDNSIFRTSMGRNIATSLTDYFDTDRQLIAAEYRNSRITFWFILFFCIVIFGICVYIVLFLYRRQKSLTEERIEFALRLQEELNRSRKENINSVSVIKNLLSTKYELLEHLCGIVLSSKDTKTARRKIADTVTMLIENLSIRSEKIVELENYVDSMYNNLFTDFRNDFPSLKEADYRLYLFSVLGLSNATLQLLLKEDKVMAVYNRKKRLREKLRQLNNTKGERYLSYFTLTYS